MLADDGERQAQAGALDSAIHLPGEWLSSLIGFIGSALPGWRDDPRRPAATGETALTAQLCARLASICRHSPGWDFLQFRREEPDESDGRRAVDIAVAPSGSIIWIEGREYTEYQTLLPVECKRLPTPMAGDRDEREYLYSRFSTTGGIQRFKAGHHAASHARAAMIGYVQDGDISSWLEQLCDWVEQLEGDAVEGWSAADKLQITSHDTVGRVAALRSGHARQAGLGDIELDHVWIEM
ncbi:hypothetical protein D6851_03615 [Altericroceibacterium spongiae]|uniref:Uncharacterized protein n=1 Tax=Altericroceibacterium spongiae TaxID=2320269 RepID=A0A420ENT9_9SPHN|nr:hypothetical protein [Altericroceibacterium spongiae]RKF22338.1 hypothetical protein D6851_03615 [Altericroceibacterium spongiae]